MTDKTKMKDTMGRYITQGLFLETTYDPEALYTLKDDDLDHKGKVYPSLKKLYLEMEDVTEYDFANRHLVGWKHWKRLQDNKILREHIEEWREELELKIRSQAIRDIIDNSANGSYQASKYLADRSWDKKGAGRPSKVDKEREDRANERLDDEFSSDMERMKVN